MMRAVIDTNVLLIRAGPIEGLVIRRESEQWVAGRAKLVHPRFVQNIGEHWRRRKIEWNALQHGASTGRVGPIARQKINEGL